PLQMIAVEDIGRHAARAFINPDEYSDRAISLAGDEVNSQQVDDIFRQKLGHGAGATYGFLGKALLWGLKEMGLMMDWFKKEGYGAISQTKTNRPRTTRFRNVVGKEEPIRKQKSRCIQY